MLHVKNIENKNINLIAIFSFENVEEINASYFLIINNLPQCKIYIKNVLYI